MAGLVSADPDLVWCKRCGLHQALKAREGVCPVCDPNQGNEASSRAHTGDTADVPPFQIGPFPLSEAGTVRFTIPIRDDAQLGFDPEPDWSSWRDQLAGLRAFVRRMFDLTDPAPRDEELPRGS